MALHVIESCMSVAVASAAYECACVLFSIAAMQTHVANSQSLSADDGLKLAAKLLQVQLDWLKFNFLEYGISI